MYCSYYNDNAAKTKADLEAKNKRRREEALRGMEVERKQEAAHKKEQA